VTVARAAPRPAQPRLSVRVHANDPATEARLIAALNSVDDISVTDADAPDVLVIAIDGPAPEPRGVVEAAAGARGLMVLVDHADREWLLGALHAGACAVLPRSVEPAALIQAVRAVAAGLVVLHPDALTPDDRDAAAIFFADADPDAALTEPLEPLTERELQVLHLLSDGLSNKAIGRRLAISDHTVKFHLAAVFSKLDAKTRAEALARGIRFGLVHL
jgi:two-component system, NarL family, response regulator YdfI